MELAGKNTLSYGNRGGRKEGKKALSSFDYTHCSEKCEVKKGGIKKERAQSGKSNH